MAKSSKLRVMISSRCRNRFPPETGRELSDIRKDLKKEIESSTVFGKQVFEVWINEEAPPESENSCEHCIKQAKECDILLALYDGHAGWARAGGEVGICHAELEAALSQCPGKVSLISLKSKATGTADEIARNKRFREFVDKHNLFYGGYEPDDEERLKEFIGVALHHSVISLAQNGVREISKGKFHSGQALDWSRMDFNGRSKVMIESLRSSLCERPEGERSGEQIELRPNGKRVLVVLHAIPAALTVPQAKEKVGQPFLRDHELASDLGRTVEAHST